MIMKRNGFAPTRKAPSAFLAILVTILLAAILGGVFYFIFRGTENGSGAAENVRTDGYTSLGGTGCELVENEEMRGVWIASVLNINFPSKTELSEKEWKAELDAIVENCVRIGFNNIFFQVRPSSDALYPSDIFPWSEYLTGTQGKAPKKNFDCLAYLIEKAHARGVSVHAWINPFRITMGTAAEPLHDVTALSEDNPARLHPEYTVAYADGKLYFDPGCPEARELVLSGVREICENYPELDGIHYDDYFYPYPVAGAEFDDAKSYALYGNGRTVDDFRRDNVNLFIKDTYDTVKSMAPSMRFGVSPFGIWANESSGFHGGTLGSATNGLEGYSALYCDALAWARGGYVDYLVPQDYWSFGTSDAPFDTVAEWWNANLDGTGVDLYIGHAAYKAADYGKNELPAQVQFGRSLLTCKGSVLYGYADIIANTAGVSDGLKKCFEYGIMYSNLETNGALLSINYPSQNIYTQNSYANVFGSSDPAYPVTVNDVPVSRTKDGYFAYFTPLSDGKNTLLAVQNGKTLTHVINKGSAPSSGKTYAAAELSDYKLDDVSPSEAFWCAVGDTLRFSCSAPSGSRVTAKIGALSVELEPTLYSGNTSKNYSEVYEGELLIEDVLGEGEKTKELGALTFSAEKGRNSDTLSVGTVNVFSEDAGVYVETVNDYTYFKGAVDSLFYDDPSPMSIGMRDYITSYDSGFYKLRCGYYVPADDVTVYAEGGILENRILSCNVEADIGDTSNNLHNSTDVRFGVLENIPMDIQTRNGYLTLEFFNTDPAFMPEVKIGKNPMVTGVSFEEKDGNLLCRIDLVSAENYYGFHTVYENGMFILKLNNPQSMAKGDKPLSGKTVIVDAGHGGKDIGAPGPSGSSSALHEADLNLGIALVLRDKLESLGAKVIMIRETDETVDLYTRIDILASMIPDMMISVHQNSVADTTNAAKARGFLGLYSDMAGVTLARTVSDTVCSELARTQRPTAYQMLAVARNHRYPSTLCEMSFISNPEEFQWTITPGNYERSAEALTKGILNFYALQEKYLQ